MNILIATDGSEYANQALDFMLRFPFPRDSRMTVLTVVSPIPMLPAEIDALDESQSQSLEDANKRLFQDAEELVARDSSRLWDDGWPGEAMVRIGNPVDEILQVAEEVDADLIVVGSHGTGLSKRFQLGSVSDRVLEYATCSVLIVKAREGGVAVEAVAPGTNAPYKIMLAYDHSEVAQEVLNICSSLPLEAHSRIDVVNVMPLITAYRQDIRQQINTIWLQKKQVMQQELENAVMSLKWVTPDVRMQLREAEDVSDEILTLAEEADSDLIMFGCKDRGAIKNFLVGSITRRMARYAKCAVWAVRKKTSV